MKKVVVIGGGTGSYTVLRGLKKYSDLCDLTAIISMFDSGGSTGILRDEYDVLPPGDIRRALIALGETELMRNLFKYRFSAEKHSLGNLILTALGDIAKDEAEGYKLASKILNVKGNVLPVTTDHSHFMGELENGKVVEGEDRFDNPDFNCPVKKVWLKPAAEIYPDCSIALKEADMIVIGPGSLYTSVISNLLVEGFSDALSKSCALKVYVVNIMTQPGETSGLSVSDHVKEIEQYLGKGVIDIVIVNNKKPDAGLLLKYEQEGAKLVSDDSELLNYKVMKADLLYEPDLIRHHRLKLAKLLKMLLEVVA